MPKKTSLAPTWNHAYDLGFAVTGSMSEDGSDVTAAMLRAAIRKRLRNLPDAELLEACGAPFDSYEE